MGTDLWSPSMKEVERHHEQTRVQFNCCYSVDPAACPAIPQQSAMSEDIVFHQGENPGAHRFFFQPSPLDDTTALVPGSRREYD